MSDFKQKLYQSQELKQEMKINPRLYQAMELLYMPLLHLEQHLKQEMTENPFLELTEPEVETEVELDEEGEEELEDEIDWEEILLDGFSTGGGGQSYSYEKKDYWRPTATETQDLRGYLTEQLHLLSLDDRERFLGEEIIGNVEDNGSLPCSLEEVVEGANEWLAEERTKARKRLEEDGDPDDGDEEELEELEELFRPFTLEEAEAMLRRIQEFDPPGVGARDLRESILIQLRRRGEGEDALSRRLVEEHWDDLINHRWSDLARSLGVSPREVQDAADEIAKLDPKPGLTHSDERDRYVIPDLIVEKIAGEYHVFLNDTRLPRLRISKAYREVAKNKDEFKGENKEFISRKLNAANWMIQAIEQRRQTMLKVMNFIVDRQREFFEKGVQHLRPLTLREVAEHIDMHESTVSRVTNEKYVQTPRGVYSLKYFFSSGISTTSGEDISARGVKDKIRNLIEDEDPQNPHTDQAIVDLLAEEGVQIARRTVAKYRDQMGVLSARMRRRV